MYTIITNSARRRVVVVGLAVVGALALGACGEDGEAHAKPDRPSVTFTATDTSIEVPKEVPSGYVDIQLRAEPGKLGHHIFVARLNDGVTFDETQGDDSSFFTKMTIKGGNGVVAPGQDVSMTLDLEPGNYFVLDNPQNEDSPTAQFSVVDSGQHGRKPDAKGIVTMGPGTMITPPDNFDGIGTWEFVNQDPDEVHEASLVRLADGKTATDLVDWGAGGFQGPPPIDGEFGSMGAIGPGQHAWITIEPSPPGDYVLVCFVPGRDGVPHLAKGMVTPVTVNG